MAQKTTRTAQKKKVTLTPKDIRALALDLRGGMTRSNAAIKYNVSPSTIGKMLTDGRIKIKTKIGRVSAAVAVPKTETATEDQVDIVSQLREENRWLRSVLEKWMAGEFTAGGVSKH